MKGITYVISRRAFVAAELAKHGGGRHVYHVVMGQSGQ